MEVYPGTIVKAATHYGWPSFVTTEAFWQAFYFPTLAIILIDNQ